MAEYKHSVSLYEDKCRGCTHCLKRCPTEAIRIRNGLATINPARCVDCGVCIKVCPHKAKRAVYDKIESVLSYKYKVALPAPSLYGQFENLTEVDYIIQGLYSIGFDSVFEVARAAEIVSGYTRRYLKRAGIKKPVISSACPVIVRLISLRFPYLCENVLPILPPMELAGQIAKKEAMEKHPDLKEEDIAICFISPCPAKVSYIKNELAHNSSSVNCVISISDIYFQLISAMKKLDPPTQPLSKTGMIGMGWAAAGGEAAAIFNDKYLAADGIENVIRVLDEIDNGNFPALEYIELNACDGGCVGGTMNVENPYIAKARLQTLKRYLPVTQNWNHRSGEDELYIPQQYITDDVEYKPVSVLDENVNIAIKKMADIQKLREHLPDLDCGYCGSPTCQAFAYDVIKGEVKEDECVIRIRRKINELLKNKDIQI